MTAVVEDAIEEVEPPGATVVDPVEVVDADYLRSARVLQYEFKRDFDRFLANRGDAGPYDSLAGIVESRAVAPAVESWIAAIDALDVDVGALKGNVEYLRRLDRGGHVEVDPVRRMVEHDLGALLYPPSTVLPVERPEHQPFEEMNCELAAHTGLPSIVVPAGFTDDGLPVGVELLDREFSEPRLFELAYAYGQAMDHHRPPDGFGEFG